MIHYISPYRADKNIGLAINTAIRNTVTEPNDWFVLTDHDTLFLLPDTKAQIERILQATPYDVLGCMTNRIRSIEQLYNQKLSDSADIREHIVIARELQHNFSDTVVPAQRAMAAFMLCFRYSTWLKVGGFLENNICFDKHFHDSATRIGLKVGLMKGVYVWHSYRLEAVNPKSYCKHLM